MLFNKNNKGAQELRELLGFIDASTNFSKWITWLELSKRQTVSILGKALYKRAEDFYKSNEFDAVTPEGESNEVKTIDLNKQLVRAFQLAIALFAYVKMLPTIDANHSNGGRVKAIGENERSLTAVEAYKDEQNIQNLAYEALEDLIQLCEENTIDEWESSEIKKITGTLLIKNAPTFNLYYTINSTRLYFTLVPMIKEVQERFVIPIITKTRFDALMAATGKETPTEDEKKLIGLLSAISRPLTLQTMVLALQRLPLEILPEGIVQVQIIGTVKEKLAASEIARKSMIDNLSRDAEIGFNSLQEEIALIINPNTSLRNVEPPHVLEGVKGFVF